VGTTRGTANQATYLEQKLLWDREERERPKTQRSFLEVRCAALAVVLGDDGAPPSGALAHRLTA
jgi:hypothetical protein